MPIIALTLDDAPSVHEPGVPFDVARMDCCREILMRWGVRHCVAFVVGARAEGHEAVLERWLAAGFELGNHTHAHEAASEQTDEQFAVSLGRCDAVLQRVGAFADGRQKWFRFPRLDRGRDAAHREQLARQCESLGYRIAPASIDFLDYLYEARLAAELARRDEHAAVRVEQRFLHSCMQTLGAATAWSEAQSPALPHISYAHFGPVAERNLGALLHLLRSRRFELCALASAVEHPVYRSFAVDFAQSGLVLPATPRTLHSRIRRRLATASERLGLFEQRRYGPMRPH